MTAREVEVFPIPPGARMQTFFWRGLSLLRSPAISPEISSLPLNTSGGWGTRLDVGIGGWLVGVSIKTVYGLANCVYELVERTLYDLVMMIVTCAVVVAANEFELIRIHALRCLIRFRGVCTACIIS
jgi:hypothetical protein